ncbi:MAG: site-specific integrase [Gemmatimonadaceae bacterium]
MGSAMMESPESPSPADNLSLGASLGASLVVAGPILAPELRAELEELVGDAATYAAASHAPNTRRAYASDWRDFTTWCAAHEAAARPADPRVLLLYLTAAAKKHSNVRTIARRLAAITWYHRDAGFPSPVEEASVQRVWRGIRRTHARPPVKKSAVILEQLRAILPTEPTMYTLRDRAVLLLGWAGAFRRSELAGLDVEDCRPEGPKRLVVTVRQSKTDQESAGLTKVILRGEHPETCPIRALDVWRKAGEISAGPLFRGISKTGRVLPSRLSDRTIARIVQGAAARAGFDVATYAGHSLRAGFITEAYLQDVSEADIMEQSGHRSIAVARQYRQVRDLRRRDAAGRVGL